MKKSLFSISGFRSLFLGAAVACGLPTLSGARAGMWNDERYTFGLRADDSSNFFSAFPGSHLSYLPSRSMYDRDGDRSEPIHSGAAVVETAQNTFGVDSNGTQTFTLNGPTSAPSAVDGETDWKKCRRYHLEYGH